MDFNCPSCNKSGNIDDAKLPESGVYATCPQCKNKFLLKPEASKDFVYETVFQSEPQQASPKTPAANAPLKEDQNNVTQKEINITKEKSLSGIGGWLVLLILVLQFGAPRCAKWVA